MEAVVKNSIVIETVSGRHEFWEWRQFPDHLRGQTVSKTANPFQQVTRDNLRSAVISVENEGGLQGGDQSWISKVATVFKVFGDVSAPSYSLAIPKGEVADFVNVFETGPQPMALLHYDARVYYLKDGEEIDMGEKYERVFGKPMAIVFVFSTRNESLCLVLSQKHYDVYFGPMSEKVLQ